MEEEKLIIYIDESGIHKDTAHSVFVLVYVKIENDRALNFNIEKIEKELNISYFHWADFGSKAGWEIRKRFIMEAIRLPFKFKYAVIDNPVNPAKELHSSILKLLLEDNIEKIFIDGTQPKWYQNQIKKSLRDNGISVKQLKVVKAQNLPVLRLADALAGLIRHYYDTGNTLSVDLYNHLKRNHLP